MKIIQLIEGKTVSKVPATTPRNFVAKNAKTGGAGAHKDKKKAAKQGDSKHKGKEIAESEQRMSRAAKGHEKYGKDGMAALAKAGREGASDEKLDKIRDKHDKYDEGFDPEYDDEAGMADNNLATLERAVQGIDDIIGEGDNLPEWCQEKIAVAKSMLITVWDYMKSEEQDGEVEEGMYRRPGSPSAYDRDYASSVSGMGKHQSQAYQADGGANDEGEDEPSGQYQAPQDTPVLQGYYFYDVPAGKEQEAASYGIKQTKSGKWAKAKYSTSGRSFGMQKDMADKSFGPGKFWSPK